MSQADVGVMFELQVARDRFKADLDAMKADFDQWRQQAASSAVEIPVRLRDEASGQLSVLLQSLQAQANAGISIPVNVGGGGGGGGGGFVPGGFGGFGGIGPAPGRMSGLLSPIGATPMFATPGIPAGIGSESFGGYDTPYGGGFRGATYSPAGAGGMTRGMRVFGAAYLALRGVTALSEAATKEYDLDHPLYDPFQTGVQMLRKTRSEFAERATGVTGFLNRGLSYLRLAPDARQDYSEASAALGDAEIHERNVHHVQRMQETLREEGFTDRFGRRTGQVSFTARERAIGAAAANAGGGEFGQANAQIDAEHDSQMEAIRKRIQHLREQGVSEQTLTQEMNSLANSAGMEAYAAKLRVVQKVDLFNNQTMVMAARGAGDFAGAVGLERGGAEMALRIQFGDTPMTQDRINAVRAENARGDVNRAYDINVETMQSAYAFSGNALRASDIGTAAQQTRALEADPINSAAIIARAAEQYRQARMTEANRLSEAADNLTALGIDNPYERTRQQTAIAARRAAQLQPDRAGEINLTAQAMIARVDREEDRQTRSNHERATVMQTANGGLLPFSELLPQGLRFSRRGGGNPEEASALDLQFNLQRQLREHSGQNPHDIQLRESIKEVGAEQARQMLAHTSDPRARTRLMGLIRKNYGPGVADSDEGVSAGSAGAADLTAAANALREAADALKGAKALYVVK